MAGVEVQANEISTAMRGFPLKSAPGYLDIPLIVLLGLIPPAVSARRPPIVPVRFRSFYRRETLKPCPLRAT
jgi:hypothetical protein